MAVFIQIDNFIVESQVIFRVYDEPRPFTDLINKINLNVRNVIKRNTK